MLHARPSMEILHTETRESLNLTLHDSSQILRESTRAHVQLHYLHKRHKQELYSLVTSWPTQESH